LLTGAGVIQAFDSRDSQTGVSGLFQGLTYEAGLSGGAWLLSSLAGNNYPTISSLRDNLWEPAFQNSLLVPGNLLTVAVAYSDILADIASKDIAGYPPTVTDPWGRLLSYQLLYGPDGGVSDTLSGITTLSNFTEFNVPYPILTALGVNTFEGECLPGLNATQYELHPYEFGSWDSGVNAFTPTLYLGTRLSNGVPSSAGCEQNYDNLGYVLGRRFLFILISFSCLWKPPGTSSNLFNEACVPISSINTTASNFTALAQDLAALVGEIHAVGTREEYAVYPNPFYNYNHSSLVSAQTELDLVDGGLALQNNPIWPLLHRAVDVIIVNDNSADTSNNFPNGTEILTTYVQSLSAGLTRMPVIPPVATFISEGLNQRPTFFGCYDASKTTIIYLPNYNYTFPSNEPTLKLEYTESETIGMIANGVQIATKGGDEGWPLCLACGLMKKAGGTLPSGCTTCFAQYCYN
jgi:lysophospholipase